MDIYLVRHAKSAHDASRWKTDDVRPLADIGRKRQTGASIGMRKLGLSFSHIWVSPFVRAQQTLNIIKDNLDIDLEPEIVDQLRVWGDPSKVKTKIDQFSIDNQNAKLLAVGHNPNMSNLVELLTNEDIYMKTSDLVHIRGQNGNYELVKYYPRKVLIDLKD